MPLSEVPHATTRGNHESSQSRMTNCSPDLTPFMPDHGFVELLWENGQIMMQGQSNRPNKRSFGNTFSHNGRFQEKDSRDVVMPKVGQFTDSMFNDFSHSVPSGHIGLNAQDDDMVPWLNYPIVEDSLQHDYCSEFSDFPGFDPNSLSTHTNAVTADRSSGLVHTTRDTHNNAGGSDPSRVRTSQLFQLSQQCQSSVPMTKSRATEFCGASTGSSHQGLCGDLPDKNLQKQDVGTSKPTPCLMNFPQFSRPVTLAKSNLQSVDRLRSHEKASTTASSNHLESTVINSASNLVIQGQSSTVPPKLESLRSAAKLSEEAVCQVDTHKNTTGSPDHVTPHSSTAVPSVALVRPEVEKGPEAVVASSSVCSANSAGPESNDCKNTTKRKDREGEESGYQSEDLEDESVGLKKPANGRGMSAKRTRAAEVHNLSERRRRDRINEKMRALQELIPNCNKVDKASMLDEAIEYLKTLQLQVQIMSMGSGLCMPPMMLPAGMQYLRPHPMAHFSPMGVNMGMGMGLGYGMGMLDMHRPQFACPSMPVGPSLHGMPGPTSLHLQMLGNPGQGFNVSMPHPPPFASLSGHSTMVNSAPGAATSPLPVADTAPSSDSKNQEQLNLQLETNSNTRELKNQTSTQVAKQSFEQSALLQMSNQTLHASRN